MIHQHNSTAIQIQTPIHDTATQIHSDHRHRHICYAIFTVYTHIKLLFMSQSLVHLITTHEYIIHTIEHVLYVSVYVSCYSSTVDDFFFVFDLDIGPKWEKMYHHTPNSHHNITRNIIFNTLTWRILLFAVFAKMSNIIC